MKKQIILAVLGILFLARLSFAQLHTIQVADGAIHQYTLAETSGTTAFDAGSSPSNGTYNGGFTLNQMPPISVDLAGNVLLDGISGHVDLGFTDPPANGGTGAWTVEFVFNPQSATRGDRIISNDHTDSSVAGFQILSIDSTLFADVGFTGGDAAIGQALYFVPGKTYICQLIYTGTTDNQILFYVNNVLLGSAATTGTYVGAGFHTSVGYDPAYSGGFANALVANVAFYNFALSPSQIANHNPFWQSSACTGNLYLLQGCLGTSHQYRLNETSGVIAIDYSSLWPPSASNGTYTNAILGYTGPLDCGLASSAYFSGLSGASYTDLNFIDPPADPTTGAWSIEFLYAIQGGNTIPGFWTSAYMGLVGNSPPPTGTNGVEISWSDYSLYASVSFSGGTITLTQPAPVNTQRFPVQLVYTGTTDNHLYLYINGSLAQSTLTSGSYVTSGTNMRVGYNQNFVGYLTLGEMQDVGFYNFALSPAQIATHGPCVAPFPSPSTIPEVQENFASVSGVASVSIPFLSPQTAGHFNAIILTYCQVSGCGGTVADATVTDSNHNSYSYANAGGGANDRVLIAYSWNVAAGANTVTVTATPPLVMFHLTARIKEFGGMPTGSDPLDRDLVSCSDVSGVFTCPITTANPKELLIAGVKLDCGATFGALNSPAIAIDPGPTPTESAAYSLAPNAGANSISWASSTGTGCGAGDIAAFFTAGGRTRHQAQVY